MPAPDTDLPPPTFWESLALTPVTRVLVFSTLAVFLLEFLLFRHYGQDRLVDDFAFSPEAWQQRHYWTLFTYAWLHAVNMPELPGFFWIHVTTNLVALIALGSPLEEFLGGKRFLALYVGGATAAAWTWMIFNPHFFPGQTIIGASGANCALTSAAAMIGLHTPGGGTFFRSKEIRVMVRLMALTLIITELAQILWHWMPGIAHSAHLGGAAFGIVFMLALRLTSLKQTNSR